MLSVRQAQLSDLPLLCDHLKRHGSESGRDGDVIFAPYEEPWNQTQADLLAEKQKKWGKTLFEIGWERCWIAADGSGIHGELKLVHQPQLRTALHRATLMMGIERAYRGRGVGSRLMSAALEWAGEQESLDWLDLYVFAHNEPALRLYTKFGFKEVGRTVDLFRVQGSRIDDIHMTLRLREFGPA